MSNPLVFSKVSDFSLVSQYSETGGGIGLEVLSSYSADYSY